MRYSFSALIVLATAASVTAEEPVLDKLRELSGRYHHGSKAKTLSVCTKIHTFFGGLVADSDSAKLYTCDSDNLATSTEVGNVEYICYPGSNPGASGKVPQNQLQQLCQTTLHIKGNDVSFWNTYDVATEEAGPASFVRDLQTGKFKDLKFTRADYVVEAGNSTLLPTNPYYNFYNVGELYKLYYEGKKYSYY